MLQNYADRHGEEKRRRKGGPREIQRDSAMWPDAKAIRSVCEQRDERDLLYRAGYKVAGYRHLV